MTDLEELNAEFFRPYCTVMDYIGLSGLNIFNTNDRVYFRLRYYYVFYFICHVISLICHWMYVMRKFSDGSRLLDIPIEFSYCNNNMEALLIFIQLFLKKERIKEFIFKMEKEWRIDESLSPKLITMKRKFVRQTVLYNKISCLSVTIACSIYLLNPLVMVFVNKIFLHRDVPYTVALGLSTPFNYDDNFFIYITLFIVEFRLALIVAYELQCSQYFITISLNYLTILFLIIKEEFKDILSLTDDLVREEKLKETITRHSKLLDLVLDLSRTFGCLFAINYVYLSSTICFCVISACVDGSIEDLKILSISLLVIANVFYCCKSGENLVITASEVSTAVYDTPWYKLPNKMQKDLIFVMMRSQRVAYVTSTSFIKISLKTFIRVLNMTWSFISLLTTVYDAK